MAAQWPHRLIFNSDKAMINQKPISLKISWDLLEMLDKEVSTGWKKRNTLINEAVAMYLNFLDCRRRVRYYQNTDPDEAKKQALEYIRKQFPGVL